ncbi:MAG: VWA domain-containing protein [Microbacteriaceae bacterium]|nr:VWA domain-containing protein [Microbacteriaceae bacterium]
MTWNPIFSLWMLIILIGAGLGIGVFCLLKATGRRRLSWIFRVLVMLMIGIACVRPGIGTASAQQLGSKVNVLFLIDVTASMNAEDWQGNKPRLEGVRKDIEELAIKHAGARFGVITFASKANRRLPFVSDASALKSLMSNLQPEVTRDSRGSSVTAAAELAEEVLKKDAEQYPDRARIVYYLGDGEQTSDQDLQSMAGVAKYANSGAVLGYGTAAGAKMREVRDFESDRAPRYVHDDEARREAISKVDEKNLAQIAKDMQMPLQMRSANSAVKPAEINTSKQQLVPSDAESQSTFELYWIFVIFAALLLLPEVWWVSRSLREVTAAAKGVRDGA